MEPYLEKMGKEIVNVTRRLNDELEELAGEGIFFMPELAFAFEVGKSISFLQRPSFND